MDERIDALIAIMNGEWVSEADREAVKGRIPSVEQVREHVLLATDPAQAMETADRAETMVKVAGGMKAKAIRPTDANLELIGKRFPGGMLTDAEKDALCVMLAEPDLPRTADIDEAGLMPPPIVLANPDPPPPPPPAPPEAVDEDEDVELYVDGQADQDDDQDDAPRPEPTPAPISARPSRFSNVVEDDASEVVMPHVTVPPTSAAKPPEDDLPDWGQQEPADDSDETDEAPESTVTVGGGGESEPAIAKEQGGFLSWNGPGFLQRNRGFVLMRRQILHAFNLAVSSDEHTRSSGTRQLEVLPGLLSDPDNFDLYGGYDACATGIRIIRQFQAEILAA